MPPPLPLRVAGGADRAPRAAPLRIPRDQSRVGRPARAGAARPPGGRLRLVTCHLGAGASLAAVLDGRSIDTTMGFTPERGTRHGHPVRLGRPGDAALARARGWPGAGRAERVLEHESGLRGLSGTSGHAELLDGCRARGPRRTALSVYLHRLRAGIAAMAASMDGIDALVFTGGVGEHSPAVRESTCTGLRFLGVRLDEALNAARRLGDTDVAMPGSDVRFS